MDYGYDGVGNRLTKVASGVTETYIYSPNTNKIDQITGSNPVTFTYDANGNITGMGNKVLTYNQNNRLVKVEEDGNTLGEYTYNGLGQRVIKAVSGVTTVFHYDFDGNIMGESDLDGSFTKEYIYRGSSRLALVDVASGEMYYYGNDRLGTPQILTDSTNTVVWEGVYKPFGEAEVNPNSSVVNNFRFPGQYFDSETRLHYNYHRYYDPRTGRYITPDPLRLEGGINLFAYVDNNPMNSTDQFGLKNGFNPPVPFPGPQQPIGAPGDDEPPQGTIIPFVDKTYEELAQYTIIHFNIPAYNRMNNDVQSLTYQESLKILCGKTVIYDLCFKISSTGVTIRFFKKPGTPSIYSEGIQCVFKSITGRKNCQCPADFQK